MVLLLGLVGWLACWLLAGCLYLGICLAVGLWQLSALVVRACRRQPFPLVCPNVVPPAGRGSR